MDDRRAHGGDGSAGAGTTGADRYEIRLRGALHPRWTAWFDGLTVTSGGDGITVITGPVADQAALHGLLERVRDLGIPLVSVTRLDEP
jgi:hypothetical protein